VSENATQSTGNPKLTTQQCLISRSNTVQRACIIGQQHCFTPKNKHGVNA
jgi:hypothetical protein